MKDVRKFSAILDPSPLSAYVRRVFIKIYIEFCGKSLKFCGRPHFPNPTRPQMSAFDKPPSALCGRPLWTAPYIFY